MPARRHSARHAPLRGRIVPTGDFRRARFESLESRCLLAVGAELVKDINTETYSKAWSSHESYFAKLNGVALFSAPTRATGDELWRTDGTTAGTVLVKDIYAGSTSSSPGIFGVINDKVVFAASDREHGRELWISDGTSGGTHLLIELSPGFEYTNFQSGVRQLNGRLIFNAINGPEGLWVTDGTAAGTLSLRQLNVENFDLSVVFKGSVYFKVIKPGGSGEELWRTDGTVAGTTKVTEVAPGTSGARVFDFTVSGQFLYFSAETPIAGRELWRTDGTATGTILVSDIAAGPGSSLPNDLIDVNGTLFFYARDGFHGYELYKTDGTPSGTIMVRDILPGYYGSNPNGLRTFDGNLYFIADDGLHGRELWKSDGTNDGTRLVKDINPNGNSNLSFPRVVGDRLFFGADDGVHGLEPWVSDGSEMGTNIVRDIVSGPLASNPDSLTELDGQLFFEASDGALGFSVWLTDGTESGSVRLVDFPTIKHDSGTTVLASINDVSLFWVYNGAQNFYLYRSDRTVAGTFLLKDIGGGTQDSPWSLETTFDGKIYFAANDGVRGYEPWISDGTNAGTVILKDIDPGPDATNSFSFVPMGGALYFFNGDYPSRDLWRTDGTESGTIKLASFPSGGLQQPSAWSKIVVVGNTLYFASNGSGGVELWKSDGTTIGTVRVADINPSGDSNPRYLTAAGDTLYFIAEDGIFGRSLWKTNGTAAGSMLIRSGVDDFLLSVQDVLYFILPSDNGDRLWKSDGTLAGTVEVSTVIVADSFALDDMPFAAAIDGTLYFVGIDAAHGRELWKTNGTPEGTTLLEINPGASGADPYRLRAVGAKVFVSATDGIHGYELWVTDGTIAGTQLAKDIWPGQLDSNIERITDINGIAYFQADDGTHGEELWRSDGTEAGTYLIADIAVPGSSSPRDIVALGDDVYFTALSNEYGRELWKLAPTKTLQVDWSGGSIVVSDAHPNGRANSLTIARSGSDLTIVDPAEAFIAAPPGTSLSIDGHSLSVPLSLLTGKVVINAGGLDDSLVVDFSGGDPVPIGGLELHGGDGNDAVNIGPGSGTLAGTLTIDGGAGTNSLMVQAGAPKFSLDAPAGENLDVSIDRSVVQIDQPQQLKSLSIGGGAVVQLAPGGSALRTGILSIDAASALDLADGKLVVNAAVGSRDAVLAQLSAWLTSGSASAAWNGPGIRSSAAASDADSLTALGIMLNDNGQGGAFYQQFDNLPVDANCVLVKYTYYGDADLNGIVDGTDYALIDNGHNANLTGWFNGDFDYSGKVDGTDYALIDNAFNSQGGPSSSRPAAVAPIPRAASAPARASDERGQRSPAPIAQSIGDWADAELTRILDADVLDAMVAGSKRRRRK